MNLTSRTITGIFTFVTLFYGIPMIIISFFILFNTKEDKIEQIKTRKVKK